MASHLQLVQAERPSGRLLGSEVLSRPSQRPGDRAEPLRLERTAELEELARVAPAAGVPFDLAFSLLAQRELICHDLAPLVADPSVLLDKAAQEQRVQLPLCGALASYLRDLQRRKPLDLRELSAEVLLAVPVRIIDRLRADDRYRELEVEALEQVRSWEIASAAQGRTMGEWATLAAAQELARIA